MANRDRRLGARKVRTVKMTYNPAGRDGNGADEVAFADLEYDRHQRFRSRTGSNDAAPFGRPSARFRILRRPVAPDSASNGPDRCRDGCDKFRRRERRRQHIGGNDGRPERAGDRRPLRGADTGLTPGRLNQKMHKAQGFS
jgi:hypothetical protein